MKKGLKTAGIVALSAILGCGALGALAACGGGGKGKPQGAKDELTVYIFCGPADATTNQKICDEWAAKYSAAHADELGGMKIRVSLSSTTDKGTYFKEINDQWSTDTTKDIIYVAPKYVRTYAERGNILDLSDYLAKDEYKNGNSYITSDVWQNSLSYYGYIQGEKANYKMGRALEINENGKFVTATIVAHSATVSSETSLLKYAFAAVYIPS